MEQQFKNRIISLKKEFFLILFISKSLTVIMSRKKKYESNLSQKFNYYLVKLIFWKYFMYFSLHFK